MAVANLGTWDHNIVQGCSDKELNKTQTGLGGAVVEGSLALKRANIWTLIGPNFLFLPLRGQGCSILGPC